MRGGYLECLERVCMEVCALSAWRVLGVLGEGVLGGVCLEGEWQSNETSYAIVGERGNCDESSIIGHLA